MQLLRLNFLQTPTPGHARLITPNYHHRVLLLCLNDPRNLNQFFYFSVFSQLIVLGGSVGRKNEKMSPKGEKSKWN